MHPPLLERVSLAASLHWNQRAAGPNRPPHIPAAQVPQMSPDRSYRWRPAGRHAWRLAGRNGPASPKYQCPSQYPHHLRLQYAQYTAKPCFGRASHESPRSNCRSSKSEQRPDETEPLVLQRPLLISKHRKTPDRRRLVGMPAARLKGARVGCQEINKTGPSGSRQVTCTKPMQTASSKLQRQFPRRVPQRDPVLVACSSQHRPYRMEGGLQHKQTALVVRRYHPQRIRNKNGYGKPRRMRPDYKPKILLTLEGNWISGHKSLARRLLDQTQKAPRVLRGAFEDVIPRGIICNSDWLRGPDRTETCKTSHRKACL